MPVNQYGFKAKTYSERVQERLSGSDWWDKNFGGDEERARNSAEREMLDEIDNNTSRKRHAESEYERYVDNYNYQSSRNTSRLNKLENEIQREHNLHTSQESKIKSLNSKIAAQTDKVIASSRTLDNITEKTNTTRDKVSSLKLETIKLKREVSNIKFQTEIKIQEETEKIRKQSFEKYNQKAEALTKKPLLYLNQNIILPLKIKQSGKAFTIPNGLLIETPSKLFSKIILSWITKKTNSNYAILNAKKYKTESDFFDALSDISEQARNYNKQTNCHTFTLINNIEKFTRKKNSQIIPYLKSFMDTTSRNYSNTIILSTKDSTKLDPILIAKHRFPLKMDLTWNFVFMKKYGFRTMLSNLLKIKAKRTKFKARLDKKNSKSLSVTGNIIRQNNINKSNTLQNLEKNNKNNVITNNTPVKKVPNAQPLMPIKSEPSNLKIIEPSLDNLRLYLNELVKQNKTIIVENLQRVISEFSISDMINLLKIIDAIDPTDKIIPISDINIPEENNYDDIVSFIKKNIGHLTQKEIIEIIQIIELFIEFMENKQPYNDKLYSYLKNADFMKIIVNSSILKKCLH